MSNNVKIYLGSYLVVNEPPVGKHPYDFMSANFDDPDLFLVKFGNDYQWYFLPNSDEQGGLILETDEDGEYPIPNKFLGGDWETLMHALRKERLVFERKYGTLVVWEK